LGGDIHNSVDPMLLRFFKDTMGVSVESISNQIKQIIKTRVFGIDYQHLSLLCGDDLYVTEYGLPFIENLLPASFWTDMDWFKDHSERLAGTSTIYRVTTKEVGGRSKDIVIKWNRMGQDIPGSLDIEELNVEFNSPFEEFALLIELRNTLYNSGGRILTHKPLAIYVPAERVDLDKLGRKMYKMEALISSHKDIEVYIFRNYAVIYEWIKGIDIVQASKQQALDEKELNKITIEAYKNIKRRGFVVADPKPHHIIVRQNKDQGLKKGRNSKILLALIDFELLKRSPKLEEEIRGAKRKAYLVKQAHRFEDRASASFPPNLRPVRMMGVDYVFGHVEGTGGALWVVGKDPTLFDYFLPEKWRDTPRIKQSVFDQVYRTTTKDNIHLVWKVSRVGELPDMGPMKDEENKILQHGYNSPFEEVAFALELGRKGIPTTYPRAIYMATSRSNMDESLCDDRRYGTHKNFRTPDGKPALRKNHDYVIFWGYWNGPDELLAVKDESPYQGVDALLAYRKELLDEKTYLQVMEITRNKLASVGIEDLNLRGNHILLSADNSGQLVRDRKGIPEIRISNFEFLRRLKP